MAKIFSGTVSSGSGGWEYKMLTSDLEAISFYALFTPLAVQADEWPQGSELVLLGGERCPGSMHGRGAEA